MYAYVSVHEPTDNVNTHVPVYMYLYGCTDVHMYV